MQAKVIKCVGGIFTIDIQGGLYEASARKTIRYNNFNDNRTILVGDNVEVEFIDECYVINSVLLRQNQLIRPPVANIDNALIMIAIKPQADLLLVDKILINCFIQNIHPILIVNKLDISDDSFIDEINQSYSPVCSVVNISSLNGQGIDNLMPLIKGAVNCLAGQSAVGKTTLLNALVPGINRQTGSLSRNDRGRHTTRHNELYPIGNNTFIADTSGFSLLEIDVDSSQLMLYYPDIFAYSNKCGYNMCSHINEPDCNVKNAVERGELSEERYFRYCRIFDELSIKKENKYK